MIPSFLRDGSVEFNEPYCAIIAFVHVLVTKDLQSELQKPRLEVFSSGAREDRPRTLFSLDQTIDRDVVLPSLQTIWTISQQSFWHRCLSAAQIAPGKTEIGGRWFRSVLRLFRISCIGLPAGPLGGAIGDRDPRLELFSADLVTEDAGDEDEELPNAIFLMERYSVHWPEDVVVGQRRNQ